MLLIFNPQVTLAITAMTAFHQWPSSSGAFHILLKFTNIHPALHMAKFWFAIIAS